MKKIFALGCLVISVMLMGTGCGQNNYIQEIVTDEAVVKRLDELAKENLKIYFDINVNEDIAMTQTATKYIPKNETSEASELLIFLAKQEVEPTEGQLYSYQIMIDAKTEALRGLYYGIYSKAEAQSFTDEELEQIGREFIKAHQMIPEEAEISLLKIDKVSGADYIKSLTYQYGEKYLLININVQDGKVMSFEYSG